MQIKANKNKEYGQTIIEAVVVLKLIISLITLVFFLIYFIYSNQIVDFFSQRTLLCLETLNKTPSRCKKDLKSSLDKLLFFHKPVTITISRRKHKNKVLITARIFNEEKSWKNELRKVN